MNDELWRESDPERIGRLALQIRELAGDTARGRRRAAQAVEYASGHIAQQRLWLGEAMNLFESAEILPQDMGGEDAEALFYNTLMLSGVQLELGLERQALETLGSIDEERFSALSAADRAASTAEWERHDDYYNLKAYILSSANDPQVRDPQSAMQAIRRVMPEGAELADYSAAELDTLAECYYAGGQPDEAQRVQRLALARARGWRLWPYLEHFRKYTAAGK